MMTNDKNSASADFSSNGYQIIQELGQNREGGRVTYLAIKTQTEQFVVIKQFQFARSKSDWSGYEEIEREIAILKHLNHPNIPKYLDSFPTADGFALVMEYIASQTLAQNQRYTITQIKQIAQSLLKILVYLQEQNPPIIHRDLKPENILVDKDLNVYLIDFGLAKLSQDLASSSCIKGTFGFIAPESIWQGIVGSASDLYSLGATLICLLTQTRSTDLGKLVNDDFEIEFESKIPHLKRDLVDWLHKLTAPKIRARFPDAKAALKAFDKINFSPLNKEQPSSREKINYSSFLENYSQKSLQDRLRREFLQQYSSFEQAWSNCSDLRLMERMVALGAVMLPGDELQYEDFYRKALCELIKSSFDPLLEVKQCQKLRDIVGNPWHLSRSLLVSEILENHPTEDLVKIKPKLEIGRLGDEDWVKENYSDSENWNLPWRSVPIARLNELCGYKIVNESGVLLGWIKAIFLNNGEEPSYSIVISPVKPPFNYWLGAFFSTYELPFEQIKRFQINYVAIAFDGAEDRIVQRKVGFLERWGF